MFKDLICRIIHSLSTTVDPEPWRPVTNAIREWVATYNERNQCDARVTIDIVIPGDEDLIEYKLLINGRDAYGAFEFDEEPADIHDVLDSIALCLVKGEPGASYREETDTCDGCRDGSCGRVESALDDARREFERWINSREGA
jgi:hypothetical protein